MSTTPDEHDRAQTGSTGTDVGVDAFAPPPSAPHPAESTMASPPADPTLTSPETPAAEPSGSTAPSWMPRYSMRSAPFADPAPTPASAPRFAPFPHPPGPPPAPPPASDPSPPRPGPEVAPSPPVESLPTERAPRWVVPFAICAALAIFAGGALAGWAVAQRDTGPAAADPGVATTQTFAPNDGGEAGIVPTNAEEPVAAVAQAVAPSVVQINTNFGLGSGIVIDDDGNILTAAHVIEGATDVRVRLANGTMLEATIVGTHPETDVGVISVEPRDDLVPAVLGIDADVQVGQLAVAVGSPFGLEQSVTSGIVSALDRPVETEATLLVGMIQTDASINPGNSGGALADRHGRVIGVNDAIRTQGGGNEGVGFAIPIDLAASVAERLINGEPIQSGFLGVSVITSLEGRAGALVQEVTPGTAAAEAGIVAGDLIVSINGNDVRDRSDLRARVLTIPPGTSVPVIVVRDGDEIELDAVIGELP